MSDNFIKVLFISFHYSEEADTEEKWIKVVICQLADNNLPFLFISAIKSLKYKPNKNKKELNKKFLNKKNL